MNFKAHARMRSNPAFAARVKMDPLQFETKASGTFDCDVGPFSAYIGEIGVRFAIPFMKPRRKPPLVGSIGGFHIKLRPFRVRSRGIALHLSGILGTQGSSGDVDAKVACETEMDVEGKFPIRVGKVHIDLCEAEDLVD